MRKARPLDARRSSASLVYDRRLHPCQAVVNTRLSPSVLPAVAPSVWS